MDDTGTVVAPWAIPAAADQSEPPTGRRRALRRPEGSQEGAEPADGGQQPTGRRARRGRPAEEEQRPEGGERRELPPSPIPNALPPAGSGAAGGGGAVARRTAGHGSPGQGTNGYDGTGRGAGEGVAQVPPGTGRRARRSIEPAAPAAESAGGRTDRPGDGRPQPPAPATWPQPGGQANQNSQNNQDRQKQPGAGRADRATP